MRLHRPTRHLYTSGPRGVVLRGLLLPRHSPVMRWNQVWATLPELLCSPANQERKSRASGMPQEHEFDRKIARKLLLLPAGRQHRLSHPGFSEEEGRPLHRRIPLTVRPLEVWLRECAVKLDSRE